MLLKKNKKRSLTVLEILIVMGILGFALTVIAVNINGMLRQQRFYSGVELLQDRLQLAQNIMVILDSDVTVTIKQESNGTIKATVVPEKSLTKQLDKVINEDAVIEGIDKVSIEGSNEMPIVLKYSAISQFVPTGILKLSAENESLVQYITLMGYPHPIKATFKPQPPGDSQNESAVLYPKEVRELWQQKLQE